MKLLGELLGYLAAAAALAGVLAGAALWLIAPDPAAAARPAQSRPIPPRIAEGIERKAALRAQPVPVAELPRPMQQADVALTPAPRIALRDLTPRSARKRKARRPAAPPELASGSRAFPMVTTARTDSPY